MNYRCCDCGAVFDVEDAGIHKEPHSIDGQTFYERWAACPECMSTNLQDAVKCPICEEWVEEGTCPTCIKEIRTDLDELMEMAKTKDGKEAVLDEIQSYVEEYDV